MERLTMQGQYNLAIPKAAYEDYRDRYNLNCASFCITQTDCSKCPIGACFDKLAEYEDAEEQGQLLLSEHKIGDRMYAIVHDDIFNCYDISEHCITDICLSGRIITDGPIGDDLSETWTKKDQEFYHVCFSMEEAEKIKAELEGK